MKRRAITAESKALKAELILNKTEELFMGSNYESVKIKDIANAAEISTGVIFSYFNNKETLFFTLLIREFIKRIDRLIATIENSTIENYTDFKKIILNDIKTSADKDSLYMKLELIRSSILEKNADLEIIMEQKKYLRERFVDMASNLAKSELFTVDEIKDIYYAETSILVGSLQMTTVPEDLMAKLKEVKYTDCIRKFKVDAYNIMENYLDGFWSRKNSL